jgi:hypothetical protein
LEHGLTTLIKHDAPQRGKCCPHSGVIRIMSKLTCIGHLYLFVQVNLRPPLLSFCSCRSAIKLLKRFTKFQFILLLLLSALPLIRLKSPPKTIGTSEFRHLFFSSSKNSLDLSWLAGPYTTSTSHLWMFIYVSTCMYIKLRIKVVNGV